MTERRLRWAIVILDLDPAMVHEQAGVRRALVVSNESFHKSGLMTICPITTAWTTPKYDGDVAIPQGHAGQTQDGIILCHQIRTVSLLRIKTDEVLGDGIRYVTDQTIKSQVRDALHRHVGLDIPFAVDSRP